MPADVDVPPALRLLFAQVLLAARREAWVGDAVAAALGHDAATVLATARRRHPVLVPATEDDLAALGDPHESLARLSEDVLAREAAGQRALLLLHGDDAEVRLRLAAFDHGLECGREVAAGRGPCGPSEVFDALASCVLEGRPGAAPVVLLSEEQRRVRWAHERCPYRAAWSSAGAESRPACHVMSAWIRGLVTGIDPSVEYRRPKALALGDERCEHELVTISIK